MHLNYYNKWLKCIKSPTNPTTRNILMKQKYLTNEKVKSLLVAMLDSFYSFCTKHDLRFSISGGTLLGAIRHNGFIPWDDDIDLCMPRPDYEKLISLKEALLEETGLVLQGFLDLSPHETPFLKLVNKNYLSKIGTDIETSYLWLDIFPVDGLPDNKETVQSIYKKTSFIRRIIFFIISDPSSKSSKFSRFTMATIGSLLRKFPCILKSLNKKLDRINKTMSYESCSQVGVIGWGMYGIGERFSKIQFENFVFVNFEQHKFPAMGCWHEYLTGIYGDYMQLPPIEKRTAHDLKVWHS